MNTEDWNAPTDRINAGGPIPTVSAVLVERWWSAVSSIPPTQRNVAIGVGAFAGLSPDELPQGPEQQIALMMRVAILQALVERGVLNDYMTEESTRKAVFAAVASIPCTKDDFGEALAEKILLDMPPERRQEGLEEFKRSGYDPNHLHVLDKIITWIDQNR